MTDTTRNPLEDLVDSGATSINRDRLLQLLKPYIRFDKSGKIAFLPAFGKLDGKGKIQIILASSKARASIMPDQQDGLTPKEILDLQTVPVGTGKSVIKTLFDSHKIGKTSEGRYFLPDFLVDDLLEAMLAKALPSV